MLLTDPQGPEFSTRIMTACTNHGVKTVDELREKLPELHKWRGLGKLSILEIKTYYDVLDNPQKDMFESYKLTPEIFRQELTIISDYIQRANTGLMTMALNGSYSVQERRTISINLMKAYRLLSDRRKKRVRRKNP